MKNSFYVTAMFFSLLVSACSEEDLCLVGSGEVNEYVVSRGSFDRVSLIGPVNLEITQGPVHEVIIVAEPEMYLEMIYETEDGELTVGFEDNVRCFNTNHGVLVRVTAPEVKMISQAGEGMITCNGSINQEKIVFSTSGIAQIKLQGNIEEQRIDGSGVVTVKNFDLHTKVTKIDVSGDADIEVSCMETLNVEGSGSANIKYKGYPAVSNRATGDISIIDSN